MNRAMRIAGACCAVALASVACGDPAPPQVTFDGPRAIEYAKAQVDAGARVPGTEPHVRVGDWIVANLQRTADTVIEQRWKHKTASGDSIPLRNIFAQFNRGATTRVLYLAHWDSRPRADKSFANDDRTRPVPGANDGASGVALLLVLAEALKATPPQVGVDLLFTDGEDYGEFGPPDVDVLLGATYFAAHPLPDSSYRPTFGVLWDMIGDASLRVPREGHSRARADDVVSRVWGMAERLGYAHVFVPETTFEITDDHVPLLDRGFKVIDVIDLDYAWHHTTGDTMDKISAQSLEIMGRVALAVIRDLEREGGAK